LSKTAKQLQASLRNAGFSQSAIKAAWPDWWTDEADASPSAQNELRFSLARKLGLDPRALVGEKPPKFLWTDRTKFKRLTAQSSFERGAISSFGTSVARSIIAAVKPTGGEYELHASSLRKAILTGEPFVRLESLLGSCWALGIPVAYLQVFPLQAKRMSAMTVRVGDRYAILLGQKASYPAPVAYYIAHELGHIALGHVKAGETLIDVGDILRAGAPNQSDAEELQADRYALELLTGMPEPDITTNARSFLSAQLAAVSVDSSSALQIEPGVIALCFGHSTGRWNKAYGALRYIYGDPQPMAQVINHLASQSIEWGLLSTDTADYLRTVLGIS
jgi:hypothetical protein